MGVDDQIYNIDIVTLVYNRLRQAIFSDAEFKAGGKLNIDKLSLKWKVSKTPIREALKSLERENIIEHIPRKGFFISLVKMDELKDLADLRLALEIHALKKGFKDMDIDRVKLFLTQFRKAHENLVKKGKVDTYLKVDDEFHFFIIESSKNKKMAEIYKNMSDSLKLLRIQDTFSTKAKMGATLPEHEKIINAILSNDKENAIDSLTQHLSNLETRLGDEQNRGE